MNNTSIEEGATSYKRGVIFGLTMAEVFLLLVFCLLLFIATQDKKIDNLVQENIELGAFNSGLNAFEIVNVLDQELWRLIEEAEITTNNISDELRQALKEAKEWDTLTNQTQKRNFRKLGEIASSASPEELLLLIKNSEQAMNDSIVPTTEEKFETAGNNWPPIISLPEAENYSFKTGSAQLTESFKNQLDGQIVQQILKTLAKYEADLIEVIGHTDLQPMSKARATNLDVSVMNFFETDMEFALRPKDNVGLGYARALSVTKHLLSTPELQQYTILPYSAAQMITPNGTISKPGDDFESSQLRRIEIRVRRQNK
jgi:flagellar motor protein MotB